MLGKLMKHEWIATKRILLPVNLAIILITLIGCMFLGTDILQNESSLPSVILLLVLYIISLVALCLVSSIYLLVRFYKNLFSSEGYLMFTLPVTPAQLLNSKLIVAFLWTFFNSILTVASIFMLGVSSGYYTAAHGDSSNKGAFLSGFNDGLTGGAQDMVSFQAIFGYSPMNLVLLCAVSIIIGSFFSLLMGYFAITLGQLVEQHKVAASIGLYIAFYIGTQILSSVIMVIVNIHTLTNTSDTFMELMYNTYRIQLPAMTLLHFVLGILFYIITLILIRKKINLD